jgi:hypothetical protein
MHQYLDSDGSGTNGTCISPAIGAQRIQDATVWLQQNNLKGYLGEIGAGSNGARRRARDVSRGRSRPAQTSAPRPSMSHSARWRARRAVRGSALAGGLPARGGAATSRRSSRPTARRSRRSSPSRSSHSCRPLVSRVRTHRDDDMVGDAQRRHCTRGSGSLPFSLSLSLSVSRRGVLCALQGVALQ